MRGRASRARLSGPSHKYRSSWRPRVWAPLQLFNVGLYIVPMDEIMEDFTTFLELVLCHDFFFHISTFPLNFREEGISQCKKTETRG